MSKARGSASREDKKPIVVGTLIGKAVNVPATNRQGGRKKGATGGGKLAKDCTIKFRCNQKLIELLNELWTTKHHGISYAITDALVRYIRQNSQNFNQALNDTLHEIQ